MIGAAAAYMAGLFFASFFTDPAFIVILIAVIAAALITGRKYHFSIKDDIMLAVFFCASVLVFNVYSSLRYAPAVALDGSSGSFRGEITDIQDYSGDSSLYIIKGKANGAADIKATFYSDSLIAECGDVIIIENCTFSKQKDDYLFKTERYYKANGIFLSLNSAEGIDVVHSGKRTLKRYLNSYRERIISDFHTALGKDSGDFLSGMVFGEKRGMDKNLKTAVYRCGAGHILAVSGLHVSIVILILMTLLRRFRVNKYVSFAAMEVMLVFFIAMANYPVSAIRAGIMMNFLYAARLFRRQNDTFNSLSGAVLIICVSDPYVIYDTGFILSVAGTFGIGVFAPYMTKEMPRGTIMEKLILEFSVMLCTMLCVFPFSLLFFDETSLISPFTNILIVPLCFVSMTAGLLYAVTGGLIDVLFIPKAINELILRFSDSMARIRFTHFSCSSKAITGGLLICMIIVFFVAAIFRNKRFISGMIAASAAFLFISSAAVQTQRRQQVIAAVLGKGSNAVLVVSSGDSADIIDLSGHYRSPAYARKYLEANAVENISTLVLTKKVQSGYANYSKELEYTDTNGWLVCGSTEITDRSRKISYFESSFTIKEPNYSIDFSNGKAEISSEYGNITFIPDDTEYESENGLRVLYGKASKYTKSDKDTIDLSECNNLEIVLSRNGSFTIRRL